ncbi:hypothetical protein HDU79_000986, partial [Rhizoclosmatium sp. JEL0117]
MASQDAINTIHLYFHHIDNCHKDDSSAEKFANLFEEGGIFSYPRRGLKKQGRQELKDLCVSMGTRFKGFNHFEHNIVLERVDDTTFKNVSYWSAVDQGLPTSIGRHYDTLVLVDGKWLFRERLVT